MGQRVGEMVQPSTGLRVEIYQGWSWPCFFFGPFWYAAKRMWGMALVWLALAIATASVVHWLAILVVPWFANRQYVEHLGEKGWTVARVDP